jgi:DNA/RNA-binding domain of Phe-tRNA-synthetase-like protein
MEGRVVHELTGWRLVWARLEAAPAARDAAGPARAEAAIEARRRFATVQLSEVPIVAAIRRLFREAGTDPTRYRPSSEALLRRLLKGEDLPGIHPLVDLNNCLSVRLAVPSCVMADGTVEAPIRLRRGAEGERMDSLRGDFDLTGKPLLSDVRGPFGTPITDSLRVAIGEATSAAWLVAYLPEGEDAGMVYSALDDAMLWKVARRSASFVSE